MISDDEIKGGKKRNKERSKATADWLITFGDMTTLLLTFFIILLSTAKIDGHEMKIILSNFPGLDHLLTGVTFVDGPFVKQSEATYTSVSEKIDTLLNTTTERISALLEVEFEENIVLLTSDERGLTVSLASDHLFQRHSAKVDLVKTGDMLRKIASLLRDYTISGGKFRVEGHSDEENIPIGLKFEDKWELSAARAVSILKILETFLVPLDNAHVSGYGDTRPFTREKDEDNPFNRRVDIILLDDGLL